MQDAEKDITYDQRSRMRRRGICVIVPTYNNAGTIRDVIERCKAQCHDVIVVNDGCTDGTAGILSAIEGITVVTLPRNSGKGNALRQGFRKAMAMGFAYAVTIDADGQHFPEDIPLMLRANVSNAGAIIVGERKDLDSMERSGGSRFANAFSNFWFCVQTLRRLRDTQSGFRLYPLRKLHGLSLLTSRYEAELELLVFAAWHGVRIVQTPVSVYYPPKEERVSHFRPGYDFTRISILNTVLCLLAVCYALPLALLRGALTAFRTAYALLFFLATCLFVLLPATCAVMKRYRSGDRRTWKLHRLLYLVSRFTMIRHGIPGVRYTIRNPRGETFDKPAMIICNHQSSLDIMAMLALSPRIVILTKDWVYNNPFFGLTLRHAEFHSVSMGTDKLMPKLRSLVSRGYSIMIYPEGTRSPDGSVLPFYQGAFWIARELELDILPVVEHGPAMVLPRDARHLRRGFFRMTIDRRITPQECLAMGEVKDVRKWMRRYYIRRVDEECGRIDN